MAHQRFLRLLASALLAVAAIAILMLPSGLLPAPVGMALAVLTALVLVVLIVLTLRANHRFGGIIQALLYAALVMILAGGVGSHYLANEMFVELPQNSSIVLDGRGMSGYRLAFESVSGDEEVCFDVVLTRPDQLSYHESISAASPMDKEGIEVHPIGAGAESAIFLVKWDAFQPLVHVGGVLFLVMFCLSALPFVRKGGEG